MNKGLFEQIRKGDFTNAYTDLSLQKVKSMIEDLSKHYTSTSSNIHFPRFISNEELACMTVEQKKIRNI
jgi:Ca2+-binding EF-hand superfamily protein